MLPTWHNWDVMMRQDCKHYQSRTYPSGDTVRKCSLDLAPEAPWNCPADCSKYMPRLADVGWQHGSLVVPKTPAAPASVGDDPSIGALLDSAENIINAAGADIRTEVDAERQRTRGQTTRRRPKWWPFKR
jgi:hypothetical protein